MNRFQRFLALLLVVFAPIANAAPSATVKEFLLSAITAPDGQARGILYDRVASQLRTATGSTDPVIVEVTTLKNLDAEGCKRLNLRIKQTGVPKIDGGLGEFGIDYRFNLCQDGTSHPGE